jgi:hypothetical protein
MRVKLFGVAALALSFALLFAAGASSQPKPGDPALPPPGVGGPAGDLPGAGPRPPLAGVKQLMAELAKVRQEKADLARKEKEIIALLRQRLDEERKALQDLERQVRELEGPKDVKDRGKDRSAEKK